MQKLYFQHKINLLNFQNNLYHQTQSVYNILLNQASLSFQPIFNIFLNQAIKPIRFMFNINLKQSPSIHSINLQRLLSNKIPYNIYVYQNTYNQQTSTINLKQIPICQPIFNIYLTQKPIFNESICNVYLDQTSSIKLILKILNKQLIFDFGNWKIPQTEGNILLKSIVANTITGKQRNRQILIMII